MEKRIDGSAKKAAQNKTWDDYVCGETCPCADVCDYTEYEPSDEGPGDPICVMFETPKDAKEYANSLREAGNES